MLVLIVIGLASALMLSLDHIGALALPGCGPGSGCAAAARSEWAKVGGLPVAFIGLGYFVGLLVVWIGSRGKRTGTVSIAAHLAVAASIFYLGVAAAANLWCVYCLAVHAINLLLFPFLRLPRPGDRSGRPAFLGLVTAAACLAVLFPLHLQAQRAARESAEKALADSTAAMVQKSRAASPQTPDRSPAASNPSDQPADDSLSPPNEGLMKPLAGRYRRGPEKAPIRIVMFTDYQCPDCAKIEQELRTLMESRTDLSVGIRYFPLSNKCNPQMGSTDLHPNACWAARAAETAGMLYGAEGFWKMHQWLFDRRGSFTDAELPAGLAQLGFERTMFERVMQGPQTAAAVKEDIESGRDLGLYFTPMIFINGVELKGWNAPNALTRAVERVAASNPPAIDNAGDVPPNARERYLADWREMPVTTISPRLKRHTLSPPDATVEVVLIGDYQEKNTAEADGLLRAMFTGEPKPRIRYSFAHFPVHSSCNPQTTLTLNNQACRAARTAEGADAVGGPDLFWKMHDWLMRNQNAVHDDGLAHACEDLGIDPEELRDASDQPFTAEAVAQDAKAAAGLGITSVPLIYINGKKVPRWKLNNENLLAAMVMEAAEP